MPMGENWGNRAAWAEGGRSTRGKKGQQKGLERAGSPKMDYSV